MPSILVFVLFFAGVYFLLLRPQQQRVRRQRELITAIGVGDRVVTAGGLIGRVVDVNDDRLLLEIADGVIVELLRLAVSRRLDDSESISDSVFGATSPNDELEEAYAADDYRAEPESTEGTEPAEDIGGAGGSGVVGELGEFGDAGGAGVVGVVGGAGGAGGAGGVDVVDGAGAEEVDEAGVAASGAGNPSVQPAEPPVPPASAGGAAVPGGSGLGGAASPGGAVGPDSTIEETAAPAPRQDPH